MKIVFFTSRHPGGRAERVCCNLANFLCQREHDIEFITISDDEATYPLSTKISRQALLHQQERSNFLHDTLLRFYRVCKLIRKTRCDCYIVMLPIPTILLLSLRFLTKAKIIASERVDPSTYPPSKQKRLKKVAHKADGWVNYGTFSLWDTYRAAHPLLTYTEPVRTNDMIKSFLAFYDQNGRLPVWNYWGSETDMMIGYHAVPVIVDAYLKGIGDLDAEKALRACVATAN